MSILNTQGFFIISLMEMEDAYILVALFYSYQSLKDNLGAYSLVSHVFAYISVILVLEGGITYVGYCW